MSSTHTNGEQKAKEEYEYKVKKKKSKLLRWKQKKLTKKKG